MGANSVAVQGKKTEMSRRGGFTTAHFLRVGTSSDRFASMRRAKFTAPNDKCDETRCYVGDPDEYIIEIEQSKS